MSSIEIKLNFHMVYQNLKLVGSREWSLVSFQLKKRRKSYFQGHFKDQTDGQLYSKKLGWPITFGISLLFLTLVILCLWIHLPKLILFVHLTLGSRCTTLFSSLFSVINFQIWFTVPSPARPMSIVVWKNSLTDMPLGSSNKMLVNCFCLSSNSVAAIGVLS